jgi:hypothetical protein
MGGAAGSVVVTRSLLLQSVRTSSGVDYWHETRDAAQGRGIDCEGPARSAGFPWRVVIGGYSRHTSMHGTGFQDLSSPLLDLLDVIIISNACNTHRYHYESDTTVMICVVSSQRG